MAHLLRRYPNTNTSIKFSSKPYTLVKRPSKDLRFGHSEKPRNFALQSFSSSSRTEGVGFVESNGTSSSSNSAIKSNDNGDEFEYLASDFGWKVRRLGPIGEEIRSAARVQAEAFHEPASLFNDFFFEFFQVLMHMQKSGLARAEKCFGTPLMLNITTKRRYACLVAVPESEASNTQQQEQQLVGVVDATVLRDQNVLKNLPTDAEEYLYISGIAVLENFRRRKIATVLLKACDMLAIIWGCKYQVLRAYEDDLGARELYSNAGYKVVSGDPPWLTTWIGRKRRVLMIRQSHLTSTQRVS